MRGGFIHFGTRLSLQEFRDIAIASTLYRILVFSNKEQSALMFIGLPTALALLLAALPAPKSATGMIMKGITLFLLLLGNATG